MTNDLGTRWRSGQLHAPHALPRGKVPTPPLTPTPRYPTEIRDLVGSTAGPDVVEYRKRLPLLEIEPPSIQPVARCYTDLAILAHPASIEWSTWVVLCLHFAYRPTQVDEHLNNLSSLTRVNVIKLGKLLLHINTKSDFEEKLRWWHADRRELHTHKKFTRTNTRNKIINTVTVFMQEY
jgi:hypothetical protein